jgi:hypothetical protein
MYKVKAFYTRKGHGILTSLPIKRPWMDATWDAHAYHCFPVTLANGLGWSVSFPEDIVFKWDGISDSTPDHVKIISGEKYIHTGRANGTISFNTGLMFRTPQDVSLLTMPVPNYFREGFQPFTTLISTSFFKGELPAAARILKANEEVVIEANTPVFAILPVSLGQIQNSEIEFHDLSELQSSDFASAEYSNTVYELNRKGEWSDFYRNATDHLGNLIGEHEVKSIKLRVVE